MTRADLAPHAAAELAERERSYPLQVDAGRKTADEAGRGLAAWRAIAALLEHGETEWESCLGETPAQVFAELVRAVEAAVAHRFALAEGDPATEPRLGALRHIRSLVLRSAIRADADLSSPPANREAA